MSEVKQFRKKPVVISAVQWTGDNITDLHLFCKDYLVLYDGELKVHTLEGIMEASVGDWIIKGVNGEFDPGKPDVFKKTYEEV